MSTKAEAITGVPGAELRPEILGLKTQFVSQGHTRHLLAKTDLMTFHIHCYAPQGGENGMHSHVEEDHVFVCLDGEAQFRGLDGPLPPLKKHQALFLPKGCFYCFSNETDKPLVMIRFGAGPKSSGSSRLDPMGEPIRGRGHEAGTLKPVLIEGAFFE